MPLSPDRALARELAEIRRRLSSVERGGQLSRSSVRVDGESLPVPDAFAAGVRASVTAAEALDTASDALAKADGSVVAYYGDDADLSSASLGDFWRKDNGDVYTFDGTDWQPVSSPDVRAALDAAARAQAAADGKVTTFYASESLPPTAEGIGDLWFVTDLDNLLRRWDGVAWVNVRDLGIEQAQQTADDAYYDAHHIYSDQIMNGEVTGEKIAEAFVDDLNLSAQQKADLAKAQALLEAAQDAQAKADAARDEAEDYTDAQKDAWLSSAALTAQEKADLAQAAALAEVDKVEDRTLSRGTDLVTNGTGYLGSNYNFPSLTFDPIHAPSGATGSFRGEAGTYATHFTGEPIPVSTGKTYAFSVAARQLGPADSGSLYAIVDPRDSDGLTIRRRNVLFAPGSTTTLAADLTPGDTVMSLTDATNWQNEGTPQTRSAIVWDYVDSSGRVWEPETYSRNILGGDFWPAGGVDYDSGTVTLTEPYSGPTISAGTPLSSGDNSSPYFYLAWTGNNPPADRWETRSAVIGGVLDPATGNASSASGGMGFPAATATVGIGWLLNYRPSGPSDIAVAAVSFSDASAAQATANDAAQAADAASQAAADAVTAAEQKAAQAKADAIAAAAGYTDSLTSNIEATQIADGAITTPKIATDAIVADKVSAGAIGTVALDAEAVTSDKIKAGAIIAGKVAADAILGNNIKAGEINAGHLSADSVTADHLSVGAVEAEAVSAGAIGTEALAAGAVVADKIAAGAIAAGKIAAGAIDGQTITGAVIQTEAAADAGIKLAGNSLDMWFDTGGRFFHASPADGLSMQGNISTRTPGTAGIELKNTPANTTNGGAALGQSVVQLWTAGAGVPAEIFADKIGGYPSLRLVGASVDGTTDLNARPQLALGFDPAGRRQASLQGDRVTLSGGSFGVETLGDFYVGGGVTVTGGIKTSGSGNLELYSSTAGVSVNTESVSLNHHGNYAIWCLEDGAGRGVRSPDIYNRTYSSSANVFITNAGTIGRATSATKYKILPEPLRDVEDSLLDLTPKTWFDKAETNAVADFMTALDNGEATTAEDGSPLYDTGPELRRIPGLIAEDLVDAGLEDFVILGEDGEPEGIMYDRLAAALIPSVRRLRDRVDELEARLAAAGL